MKVPLMREGAAAQAEEQDNSTWYATPKAIKDAVPTLQLDRAGGNTTLQGLWDSAMRSGSLAKAFSEVVDTKLDRVMSRVEEALESMMTLRKQDADRIEKLEKESRQAAKKSQSLQEKTNALLAKLMEQRGMRSQASKEGKGSRGKRRNESPAESDEGEMGVDGNDSDDELPATAKKVKGARAVAKESDLSHSQILANLLSGLGMENVQQLSTLGVPNAQVDRLVKELGLDCAK